MSLNDIQGIADNMSADELKAFTDSYIFSSLDFSKKENIEFRDKCHKYIDEITENYFEGEQLKKLNVFISTFLSVCVNNNINCFDYSVDKELNSASFDLSLTEEEYQLISKEIVKMIPMSDTFVMFKETDMQIWGIQYEVVMNLNNYY